jgi:ABC-type polysaccharide/polyol phosphate transport system ATPase subunit
MTGGVGEAAATHTGIGPSDKPERDLALVVRNVEKQFKIPHDRAPTLKHRLLGRRSRGYDLLHALDDVSVDVRQGDFFGIVGRNGSGKSTLLKCIAGIYMPDSGEIAVRGQLSTFIELGVGFNPELTARDNVVLNATLLGLPAARARERFDEIIAFAELENFVDLKLKNYSSGMHVRLAFAVAMHVSADVFLIDEVLAVGDAAFQQKCLDTFNRMRDEGRTVVLVTHDMSMVERLCNRAVMLEAGRVVSSGAPAAVAHDYIQLNFDHTSTLTSGESERWGDGAAQILDAWLADEARERTQQAAQGQWVSLNLRVRFERAMQEPIFGFTLVDERGAVAFQTNSEWDRVSTERFAAGEEAEFEVRFANHLEEGRYHISPAVAHAGGLQVADRRERFTSFLVTAERRTGGHVNLPHESIVTRQEVRLEVRK